MTSLTHLNHTGGEFQGLVPKRDRRDPSRGRWQSVANGRRATDPQLKPLVQCKDRQEDVMQTAADCDARSALMILAVCTFTIVFASIAFIASGGTQMVRSEIPTSWVIGGLQVR